MLIFTKKNNSQRFVKITKNINTHKIDTIFFTLLDYTQIYIITDSL